MMRLASLPPPLVQNPFDKFSTYSEFLVLQKTNAQVLQLCAKQLTGMVLPNNFETCPMVKLSLDKKSANRDFGFSTNILSI